jgi:ferredoxin
MVGTARYALRGHRSAMSLSRKTLLFASVFDRNFPMADKASKLPENVPGPWYVDNTCTPCRVCLEEAPNLLKYNDDETYVYFYKQPENEEETGAAQRAMDVCPTLAIGNDGE